MKTLAVALMLTTGLFTNSATAADPHLDDLAFSLKQQAALACREVRYGFQRTAAFPHLYKDFYELYTLADHIHDVAHHGGDLRHLKDDVDQLDELFHHTEELTARTGTVRVVQAGGVVVTVPACGGNVSGYHLRKLQAIMVQMEDTIHHLQEDLEAELSPGGVVVPPVPPGQIAPPAPPAPVYNPQPTYPGPAFPQSQGVRFRKGGSSFSIRIN